jgi:hypothetical protein
MAHKHTAFFYILNKPKYARMAEVSARSVKENMSDVDAFVFSPNIQAGDGLGTYVDEVVRVPYVDTDMWFYEHNWHMLEAAKWLLGKGYMKAVYMDCDTFMCEPIDDVVELLEDFDFMGAISPRRYRINNPGEVPKGFAELNIGVNPMCLVNASVMLRDVLDEHKTKLDYYGNDDQVPLRKVLYDRITAPHSDFKLHTLSPEYNFRFRFPCFARNEVRVLHGHTNAFERVPEDVDVLYSEYKEIEAKVNKHRSFRAWPSGVE